MRFVGKLRPQLGRISTRRKLSAHTHTCALVFKYWTGNISGLFLPALLAARTLSLGFSGALKAIAVIKRLFVRGKKYRVDENLFVRAKKCLIDNRKFEDFNFFVVVNKEIFTEFVSCSMPFFSVQIQENTPAHFVFVTPGVEVVLSKHISTAMELLIAYLQNFRISGTSSAVQCRRVKCHILISESEILN